MTNNYYDTLWVQKWASEAEIKKAYRKQAMQWHPDKNKGDEKAETKFKEINEAYQTLGDSQKKQQYDTFGSSDFGGAGGGGFGGGQAGGFDFGDIFGGGGGRQQQSAEFDMGDIFGAFGGGGRSARQSYQEPVEDLDVTKEVELPIWDFIIGTKLSITVNGKKFSVPVKAGTKPGKKLKVKGKGKPGRSGNGDLYLKLEAVMPKKIDKKSEELISQLRKHAK